MHVLHELAAAPAQLFDPQCSYRSIAVLAGSPTAILVRQQHDVGPVVAAGKRSMHHAVSSVVAAAIGVEPRTSGAGRMPCAAGFRQQPGSLHALPRHQIKEQQHSVVTDAASAVHRAAALKIRGHVVRR